MQTDANIYELFTECMSLAGKSLYYMDYLHPSLADTSQYYRVVDLCTELSELWDAFGIGTITSKEYLASLLSWQERFTDETENQC